MKLDDIEKLIEAASPAPWPAEFGRSDFPDVGSMACGPIITADEDAEETQAQDDQDFICMARQVMPKLLRVVRDIKFIRDLGDYANDFDWVALDQSLADLEQP